MIYMDIRDIYNNVQCILLTDCNWLMMKDFVDLNFLIVHYESFNFLKEEESVT